MPSAMLNWQKTEDGDGRESYRSELGHIDVYRGSYLYFPVFRFNSVEEAKQFAEWMKKSVRAFRNSSRKDT